MRVQTLAILISLIMLVSGVAVMGEGTDPIHTASPGPIDLPSANQSIHSGLAWNENVTPDLQIVSAFQSESGGAYSVNQIREGYNLTGFYKNNICGQNLTVAIVDAYGDRNIIYDLNSFDALYSLPPASISFYYPYGQPSKTNSSWSLETATDIEWFHAIAPKAHIDLIVLPGPAVGYLQGGVNYTVNNISSVNEISMSWGIAETQLSAGLVNSYNTAFQTATREGINVFAASGDAGAYDGTKVLTVNFPASDPNLTAVGGTTLSYSNGVFSQTAWDKTGGGYSQYFNEPSYQTEAGIKSPTRGVPDISAIANPDVGGVNVFSQGKPFTIGGTSLATPITAGTFMLIDQYLNGTLTNVNNKIYRLLNTEEYGKAVIPVTSGQNGYYSDKYGWNPVNGLGTYNGMLLAKAIARMNGFYGYKESYGTITNSNFQISTEISLNSTNSLKQGYEMKVGVFAGNRSSDFFAGILEKSSNVYIDFQGGTYKFVKELSLSTIKDVPVSLSFNVTSITFSLSGYSKSIEVIPQTLYGTSSGLYTAVSSGTGVPTRMVGGSFSNTKLSNGETNTTTVEAGLIVTPFESSNLEIVRVANETGGFSFSQSFNHASGSFGSFYSSPIIILSSNENGQLIVENAHSPVIYVNNSPLTNNTVKITPGENVSIKVTEGVKSYTYKITMPDYSVKTLNVEYPASSYYTAIFNTTFDYTYADHVSNGTTILAVGETSNITMKYYGFKTLACSFSNDAGIVKPLENPVNLSIQISPINANITFSAGALIADRNGSAIYSVLPQNVSFNFSLKGSIYRPFIGNLSLTPGLNETYIPIALQGKTKGYFLNGTVVNQIYETSYNSQIPVPGANLTNGYTQAYTDIFGCFSIWMPAGKDILKTGAAGFHTAMENISSTKNTTGFLILLDPTASDLVVSQPTITIDRLVPFMFFSTFISWSTNFTDRGVNNYIIYYKPVGTSKWSKDVVSPTSNNIAFINGIYPGKTYDFMVSAQLSGGNTVNSNIVTTSYYSPVVLILTLLIYVAIGFLIYAIVSHSRSKKKKKAMKRQFEEWEN